MQSELRVDRITVSFSLEDRDDRGRKKSAFYSVTSFLERGVESKPMTIHETRIAEALLSKHVIEIVYGDAVRRNIINAQSASEEAKAILESYDRRLMKLIAAEASHGY
jgi:hypothetical protein